MAYFVPFILEHLAYIRRLTTCFSNYTVSEKKVNIAKNARLQHILTKLRALNSEYIRKNGKISLEDNLYK